MIIGPHTSHDPNHILVEKSMQLFPGQAPEVQWCIGFSSLMPCLFLEPDLLMPGNGGPTHTVSLAKLQVLLFRVALPCFMTPSFLIIVLTIVY